MQGIALFLAGGFSRISDDAANGSSRNTSFGIGAVSMVFLFTFVFGATWLTVPWLYPAEIFPLEVRAKGNAWGVVGWSIGNGWLVSRKIRIAICHAYHLIHTRPCSARSCLMLSTKRLCISSPPAT